MKKLSVLMALVLMLLAIVPAAAAGTAAPDEGIVTVDETTAPGMEDSLIAHFDFTKTGYISTDTSHKTLRPMDASCNGVNENFYHTATAKIEGGIAALGKAEYMSMNNPEDFASCTNGMTVFMAIKLTDLTKGFAHLMAASSKSTNNTDLVFRICQSNNQIQVRPANNGTTATMVTFSAVANEWMWIAVSLNYTDSGNQMVVYTSTNGGTWTTAGTINDFTYSVQPKQIQKFLLGSAITANNPHDLDATTYYNDIQIYNRALTEAEVKSITVEESTAPQVYVQTRDGEAADTFDIRFCATIDANALANYESIGFKVVVKDAEGTQLASVTRDFTTVYTSVLAGGEPVEASDLNADYISAMDITGISTALGDLTFEITPRFTIDGTTCTEATAVYTYPQDAQ